MNTNRIIRNEDENNMANRILVAYFSATGTTKRISEEIARLSSADLFAIEAKEPYTVEDLNWMDTKSRSTLEMKDASARPAIANAVPNMNEYDTVILGYPIWWGAAPRIIDTFLESYDFTGKTIHPFCTSGGSGIGRSDENLHQCVKEGVTWGQGMQVNRPKDAKKFVEKIL